MSGLVADEILKVVILDHRVRDLVVYEANKFDLSAEHNLEAV